MSYKDPIKNRASVKKYRNENKEKIKFSKKKWLEENPDKVRRYQLNYRIKHPKKLLLIAAKARAKMNGLDFDLTEEDFEIPKFCPYLGIELRVNGDRSARNSMSLDRIDSSQGYTKGNVQVISWMANTMKNNATREELLMFAESILKIHKGDNNDV